MVAFILHILGNGVALYGASRLVSGVSVTGGWQQLLIAGVVLALLNTILRPIIKVLAFPLVILTLGLFTAVINLGMLWLLDYFLVSVSISGILALIWTAIIVSIVNLFVSGIAKLT